MTKALKLKLFALAGLVLFTTVIAARGALQSSAATLTQLPCLVIDPGHGGIDGGTISIDGTRESDLNLSFALKLNSLAEFCGFDTVMTRSDDSTCLAMTVYSEHQDLVYRAELANSAENAILFSIHQNFFPTVQPRGAQVLHSDDDFSRELANAMQANFVNCLDPENRRVAAPAGRSIYLTRHTDCPSLLVECGFMSNFQDMEKLKDEDYQRAFVTVLLGSYMQYSSANLG